MASQYRRLYHEPLRARTEDASFLATRDAPLRSTGEGHARAPTLTDRGCLASRRGGFSSPQAPHAAGFCSAMCCACIAWNSRSSAQASAQSRTPRNRIDDMPLPTYNLRDFCNLPASTRWRSRRTRSIGRALVCGTTTLAGVERQQSIALAAWLTPAASKLVQSFGIPEAGRPVARRGSPDEAESRLLSIRCMGTVRP